MEKDKKKYFNVLRTNENLSYAGLKTLKTIEDEFDNLTVQSSSTITISRVNKLFYKIAEDAWLSAKGRLDGFDEWYRNRNKVNY